MKQEKVQELSQLVYKKPKSVLFEIIKDIAPIELRVFSDFFREVEEYISHFPKSPTGRFCSKVLDIASSAQALSFEEEVFAATRDGDRGYKLRATPLFRDNKSGKLYKEGSFRIELLRIYYPENADNLGPDALVKPETFDVFLIEKVEDVFGGKSTKLSFSSVDLEPGDCQFANDNGFELTRRDTKHGIKCFLQQELYGDMPVVSITKKTRSAHTRGGERENGAFVVDSETMFCSADNALMQGEPTFHTKERRTRIRMYTNGQSKVEKKSERILTSDIPGFYRYELEIEKGNGCKPIKAGKYFDDDRSLENIDWKSAKNGSVKQRAR